MARAARFVSYRSRYRTTGVFCNNRPVDHLAPPTALVRTRGARRRIRPRPRRNGPVTRARRAPRRNSPFRRAVRRLCTFELARPHGPEGLAVRVHVPPLPLRHLSRLPVALQQSHRRWQREQRLPEIERTRRRAQRLAVDLASAGRDRAEIEAQLGAWHFHPAVAFQAAAAAVNPGPLRGPRASDPSTRPSVPSLP